MSRADGEYRQTACHRGMSSHHSCSTSTLMISHFMTERVASYTQTIYVSQPSTLSFTEVERTIGDALDKLTQYYISSSLRANLDKTSYCFSFEKQRGKTITKSGMEQDITT